MCLLMCDETKVDVWVHVLLWIARFYSLLWASTTCVSDVGAMARRDAPHCDRVARCVVVWGGVAYPRCWSVIGSVRTGSQVQ